MVTAEQIAVCLRIGVEPVAAEPNLKLGISRRPFDLAGPVHGLRHPPEGDTTGWYIWSGEFLEDPDFFEPFHVAHLSKDVPLVVPYLALPPGWRFLLAGGHEDVWHDESLLKVGGS